LNLGFSSAPEAGKADSGDDCVNGVFAGLHARAAPAAENGQQKSGMRIPGHLSAAPPSSNGGAGVESWCYHLAC